jgi:ankyrin repeat protein
MNFGKKIFLIDCFNIKEDIEKNLSTNHQNLQFFSFSNLKSAFDKMREINFELIFVILRENIYHEYYDILNIVKSNLSCFPISFIYISNNSINLNLNNSYGLGSIINSIEELDFFIRYYLDYINIKMKISPKTSLTIDYNNTLTFEKIKNVDDLIIPSLYTLFKKIEGNEAEINCEDIYLFNHVLVNKHFYKNISHLIYPLNFVKKLPLEIVTKFWIRYYTSESTFYTYMNSQLMKNIPENYGIFVKSMYKGIEKKYLRSEYNICLYRCQLISNAEMDVLEKNKMLVYSRCFLSFSKDKNKAIQFLKKGNNYLIPVMFIVNATNFDESFSSNADIEHFSIYDEKEVLFFPFSSFIVDEKIKMTNINNINTKIVYLNYLGKYRKEIEQKICSLNDNNIKELLSKDSKFVKDISSSNLNEDSIFVKDISSIKLNEDKSKLNHLGLIQGIKKAVDKVKKEISNKEDNEIINPFEILGISVNEEYPSYTEIDDFRNKVKNEKQYLSCFILDNKGKYLRTGNNFVINKDHFYYVINNDLNNLKKKYEENKYILAQKDNRGRTLLHLSVIGSYYEISEFLLKSGINYDEIDTRHFTALGYADEKNRKLLEKFGAKLECYNGHFTEGINTIKSNDINIIDSIYKDLLTKGIVEKIIDVKYNKEIVGKRLIPKRYIKSLENQWEKVYHGTKFVSIEFILKNGLKKYGEPLQNHIQLGQKINNINNWADAIFVSPSIFYASKYSELINYKNQEWFLIIEARVRPNSFSIHESTIYGYQFKKDEPKNVEYRIEDLINVSVTSLLFVNKDFLENIRNFSESLIFKDDL